MKQQSFARSRAGARFFATVLLGIALVQPMLAQTSQAEPTKSGAEASKPSSSGSRADFYQHWASTSVDRFYKLKYTQSNVDQNEVLTAMRNMVDPMTKIFLVPNSGTIVARAPEEEQARIVKLLTMLDQQRPGYRLTYTLTEMEGVRKVGVQHFSMVVISGQRTEVKQGSRIPLLTAGTKPGDPVPAYTYIDIGMNFDTTFTETQNGGVLRTKVEQSSVAPDSMAANGGNPVIRQTFFEGVATLAVRKPLTVGSVDVPGSTHHFDIEVVLEPVN